MLIGSKLTQVNKKSKTSKCSGVITVSNELCPELYVKL